MSVMNKHDRLRLALSRLSAWDLRKVLHKGSKEARQMAYGIRLERRTA